MLFNERLISQRKSPREATKQNILNAKNQAMSISMFNSSNEFRNRPTIIIATRKMLEVARAANMMGAPNIFTLVAGLMVIMVLWNVAKSLIRGY